MSVTQHLKKSPELKSLFQKIYEEELYDRDDLIKFMKVTADLVNSEVFDPVEAAYIITDLLLKYDDEDEFEKVFGLAGDLEIANDMNWSEQEIKEQWGEIKEIVYGITSTVSR